MATLKLDIVTPGGSVFSDDVDMVFLPAEEGELGILPMHIPVLTPVRPGELRIVRGPKEEVLAIGEGFAEITGRSVSILTEIAVEESAIDEGAAEAAIERAQKALANASDNEEIAALEAVLSRSLAQVNVKRRRRGG